MEKCNDDDKVLSIMERTKWLEKKYNEMSKDELVQTMLFNEIMTDFFEPISGEMSLWCFVSDETGTMYLTNERPKYIAYIEKCDAEDVTETPEIKKTYITEGEVNIRVPKMLESLLPPLKYGDEPVVVKMSVSF